MRKRAILISFILFVGLGCKYEDGAFLSLVSIPNRISGDYHIQSIFGNGVNIKYQTDTLHLDYIHLDNYNTYSGGYGGFWMAFKDTTKKIPSYWTLAPGSNKTKIVFGIFGCLLTNTPVPFKPLPGYLSDGTCNDLPWDIVKLTNNMMWLRISLNDTTYEVHLNKI